MRNSIQSVFRHICVGIAASSLLIGAAVAADPAGETKPSIRTVHGLSLFGEVGYPAGFERFDYVNAEAPKTGEIKLGAIGTFDSLNGYILKGRAAAGISLIHDTLMTSSLDEPASEYGLIATSVTVPDDYSWVEFALNPAARFHDGTPISADDVVWSFETLKSEGAPFYRYYYANVTEAEIVDNHRVRFKFDASGNRELPQIMGQLPVLAKHYWEGRNFGETTLEPPVGSGPYKVMEAVPGRSITYSRVRDYWAEDLNVNVGRNNFDRISFEYFRDDSIALEAFKAGTFDLRMENTAKNWATAYTGPAVDAGKIKLDRLITKRGEAMQGFVMNTRRAQFADLRVRKAMTLAFDFEWTNKTLFYDQYTRTDSYFEGGELASSGLPSEQELALLEPFRDQLPESVFANPFELPVTKGDGNNRKFLREASKLLRDAGWRIDRSSGILTHEDTGVEMQIEFLLVSPAFERVVAHYKQSLEKLGMKVSVRLVDPSQYQNRLDQFDFDVVIGSFAQSLSPGNEQREFWGGEAADRNGSRNIIGINDPVVDALIDKIIFAPDRAALITATRALDRVLLHNYFVVPQWHVRGTRMAMWDKFGYPDPLPAYGLGIPDIWWFDHEKAKGLQDRQAQ